MQVYPQYLQSSVIYKHFYLTPIVLVNPLLNVFNLVLITGNNHAMARDAFAPLQFIRIIFQNIIDCKQSIFWSEPLPFGKSFSSTV